MPLATHQLTAELAGNLSESSVFERGMEGHDKGRYGRKT
jgi:hypothetical protein